MKQNGYSNYTRNATKQAKRLEAESRNFKYASLSHAEKMNTLIEGGSNRQRKRLLAQAADVPITEYQLPPLDEIKKANKKKSAKK